jgi:hypothetical protein
MWHLSRTGSRHFHFICMTCDTLQYAAHVVIGRIADRARKNRPERAVFERWRLTADFACALSLRHLDLALTLAASLTILCALITLGALCTLIIFLFKQLFQQLHQLIELTTALAALAALTAFSTL